MGRAMEDIIRKRQQRLLQNLIEKKSPHRNAVAQLIEKTKSKKVSLPCINEGAILEFCPTCKGGENRHVRDCAVHDKCTYEYVSDIVMNCKKCKTEGLGYATEENGSMNNRQEKLARKGIASASPILPSGEKAEPLALPTPLNTKKRKMPLRYSYGITTVPERRETHFPVTLKSLKEAGFDAPILFVDGDSNVDSWRSEFNLQVTCRYPKIRTFGNWILALAELYIRDPWADRFAIFQDDFITYKNLRAYLEAHEMPEKGYWNLYTFPKNQARVLNGQTGWFMSNQKGLGAVALIFSRECVQKLLESAHMIARPLDIFRGWRAIDGGIVTALNKVGWREYVHSPSLVQHIGYSSSMGNGKQPLATSWMGIEFDVMSLL